MTHNDAGPRLRFDVSGRTEEQRFELSVRPHRRGVVGVRQLMLPDSTRQHGVRRNSSAGRAQMGSVSGPRHNRSTRSVAAQRAAAPVPAVRGLRSHTRWADGAHADVLSSEMNHRATSTRDGPAFDGFVRYGSENHLIEKRKLDGPNRRFATGSVIGSCPRPPSGRRRRDDRTAGCEPRRVRSALARPVRAPRSSGFPSRTE